MNTQQIENEIEAILFVAGDGVSIDKLAEALELSVSDAKKAVTDFMDKYNFNAHGLRILHYGDFYQLCTSPDVFDCLNRFSGIKKPTPLSRAAMEVLSIVVYNQPVTRSTIDKIRGVDSFGPLKKLLDREIIEEQGRLDAPGMPILYGTTPEFLKLFGLKSLEDVPNLENMQLMISNDGELPYADEELSEKGEEE